MKVRIKFSKQGNLRFVGHLDLMRYFQKAIRRAGIDIAYSEGMSPHMIMSFASPLGTGLTSDSEYMDIELVSPMKKQELIGQLNAVMADGIRILDAVEVAEGKAGKAMSLVAAADYEVTPWKPMEIWDAMAEQENIVKYLALSSIPVEREGKEGAKTVDIRPMILDMRIEAGCGDFSGPGEGSRIFLRLAAGSRQNLKPAVLLNNYASFLGCDLKEGSLHINRMEIYADKGGLVPLGELGI